MSINTMVKTHLAIQEFSFFTKERNEFLTNIVNNNIAAAGLSTPPRPVKISSNGKELIVQHAPQGISLSQEIARTNIDLWSMREKERELKIFDVFTNNSPESVTGTWIVTGDDLQRVGWSAEESIDIKAVGLIEHKETLQKVVHWVKESGAKECSTVIRSFNEILPFFIFRIPLAGEWEKQFESMTQFATTMGLPNIIDGFEDYLPYEGQRIELEFWVSNQGIGKYGFSLVNPSNDAVIRFTTALGADGEKVGALEGIMGQVPEQMSYLLTPNGMEAQFNFIAEE